MQFIQCMHQHVNAHSSMHSCWFPSMPGWIIRIFGPCYRSVKLGWLPVWPACVQHHIHEHESLLVMVAQLSLAISKQVRNQLAKVVPNDSSRWDEINEYLKLSQLFLTKKLWIFRPQFFLFASGGKFHFHSEINARTEYALLIALQQYTKSCACIDLCRCPPGVIGTLISYY